MALMMCGYDTIAIDKTAVTPLLSANLASFKRHLRITEARSCDSSLALDYFGMRLGSSIGNTEVIELDWCEDSAAADILRKLDGVRPDLIVCSDCVYQQTAVTPLINLLTKVRRV